MRTQAIFTSDQPVISFQRWGILAGVTSSAVGLFSLLGWFFDNPLLKGTVSGIAMKSNTALAFFLAGISLAMRPRGVPQSRTMSASSVLGAVVCLIGSMTFTEHLFGWNLGIDEILFIEAPGELATTSPNRMGPPGSICFAAIGFCLFISNFTFQRKAPLIEGLCVIIGVVAFIPVLGYLFRADELYNVANVTGIALSSATTFLILSFGIFLTTPGPGVKLLTAPGAGGILLRRLLPAAFLLPPMLGYLRTLGERASLYDAPVGRALLITAFILIFAKLVWSSAKLLEALDRDRRAYLESERTARAQAENASRIKDEFLATLSHELRTPLNAILGWTQLLKRSKPAGAELAKGLTIIERNARLQAQLIEDLLDMSRVISGKLRLNNRVLNLAQVVSAALQTVSLVAKESGISMEENSPPHDVFVLGDADRLQQVFWNVLSNALKFTPREGSVRCNIATDGAMAKVSIADSGQGISRELIGHIFDRFTQADGSTTRRHGGLGIGLSIVKELVSLHGGKVAARSAGLGKGATFDIWIPLAENLTANTHKLPPPVATPSSPPFDSHQVDLTGLSILVVDDSPDTGEMLHRLFTGYNATVFSLNSAEAALDLLKTHTPSVLISDIGMPGMDGYELIHRIRLSPDSRICSLPAIAVTAFARTEDQERATQAGYSAHVAKPIHVGPLIELVSRLTKGN